MDESCLRWVNFTTTTLRAFTVPIFKRHSANRGMGRCNGTRKN